MAAKAKSSSSSSCLSFLRDALLLPTRNVKLFLPIFLLAAVTTFLLQITNVLHTNDTNHKDAPSIDFAKLKEVLKKERGSFIKITISVVITISAIVLIFAIIIGSACDFAIHIIPLFAASTTYSGDRYSLRELFSKVIRRGRHLRGPLVTFAMVCVLDFASKTPLEALLVRVTSHLGLGEPYTSALSALPFTAFLYLDVVLVVAVAVSVADATRRGAGAIRRAWRLMTRVWWKEGFMLVVVHFVAAKVPSHLHAAAVAYTEKSRVMGLALLSVYALVSGFTQLFYFAAAAVYCHQATKSLKSKEVMAP